jgi:two-component system response regulator PilR (NtrC family)
MQVKLLRAIQERAVRPVGAPIEVATDVRILSATHKNLAALVQEGAFRQDLFYRLNVIQLRLPSLREHPEDIPELVESMLDRLGQASGGIRPKLAPTALAALRAYSFPGNIRELENILERAFTLCEGEVIQADDLSLPVNETLSRSPPAGETLSRSPRPAPIPTPPRSEPVTARPLTPVDFEPKTVPYPSAPVVNDLEGYLESLERAAIMRALEATRYNKTAAAEKLGISFRALRYRLKKLGMD